jgi:hypothetical protein
MRAIEDWAKELETPPWLLAAMKAARKWGEGKKVEKSTYEKAVADIGGLKLYAYAPETPDTRVPAPPRPADVEDRGDAMTTPPDSVLLIDESKQ